MEQTLNDYLKTHPPQGFRAVPHYFPVGDYVTYYFRDERCYEERVDDLLTVYLSMTTNEVVGCKIKGVKHILRTAGEFSVTLPGGPQKLGFFFFVGASMSRGEPQQKRYLEVARHAKDAELQLT